MNRPCNISATKIKSTYYHRPGKTDWKIVFSVDFSGNGSNSSYTVAGTNLRAHNDLYAAIDMSSTAVIEMENEARNGGVTPLTHHSGDTYLIRYSWLPDEKEFEKTQLVGTKLRD